MTNHDRRADLQWPGYTERETVCLLPEDIPAACSIRRKCKAYLRSDPHPIRSSITRPIRFTTVPAPGQPRTATTFSGQATAGSAEPGSWTSTTRFLALPRRFHLPKTAVAADGSSVARKAPEHFLEPSGAHLNPQWAAELEINCSALRHLAREELSFRKIPV